MIRILLADDNLLTLNQVSEMIGASGLEAVVVGQAMDGGRAAELLLRLRPDLVIADVDMPVMNGVELSRFIRERELPVKMIALSNYDSFDYVRPIMKNGAVDYLLKHEITPESLRSKIGEACSQLTRDRDSAVREEGFSLLGRQAFLAGLLLDTEDDPARREVLLAQREFGHGRYGLLLMQVAGFQVLYHNHSATEKNRLLQSVLNVCTSVLRNLGMGLACSTGSGELAVLFRFEKDVSVQAMREKTLEYASILSGSLRRLLNLNVMAECCVFNDSVEHIRKYYLETKRALEAKGFRSGGEELSAAKPVSLLAEKTLLDAMNRADASVIHRVVDELLSGEIRGAVLQAIACRLLDIGEQFREEYGLSGESADSGPVRRSFARGAPVPDLDRHMAGYLCGLSTAAREHHHSYSPHIQRTIAYIHSHYVADISLGDVAEHSGISPVYLSTKFRAEVGETFVEYLTSCRIEAAKRLLEDSRIPVKDVYREAGFRNYNYFIQKFREKTGVTPHQYGKLSGL